MPIPARTMGRPAEQKTPPLVAPPDLITSKHPTSPRAVRNYAIQYGILSTAQQQRIEVLTPKDPPIRKHWGSRLSYAVGSGSERLFSSPGPLRGVPIDRRTGEPHALCTEVAS